MTRALSCVVALSILTAGCAAHTDSRLPFLTGADFTPAWGHAAERAAREVGEFAMRDQSDRRLGRADLDGRITVVSFVYTACAGICPILIGNLKQVASKFPEGKDVVLLAHSVTPATDTPAELSRYAAETGLVEPAWRLLTGDTDALYRLARESYGADAIGTGELGADRFLHTENVYLVDGRHRLRGVYHGTAALEVRRLIEDIETLRRSG